MKWAVGIARIAGIELRVHVTFGLVLVLGAMQWGAHHGARGALFGAALTALLFGCVVLHELGHSLVARRFGLGVRQIVLLPIGGVAMIEGKPKRPVHELLIALAGPAVNVVLAAGLLAVASRWYGVDTLAEVVRAGASKPAPSAETAITWLLGANLGLAVFNMIPAFPLDGGRVLRAALAMILGPARATTLATATGQVLAVGLGAYALIGGHVFLALIAGFIFLSAGQERASEQASAVLTGVPVGAAYNRTAITLAPGERVSAVVTHILTSYQPDFAVVHGGMLLGVVTRDEIVAALAGDEGDPYVAGVMSRDVVLVEATQSLEEVTRIMGERGVRVVAVEHEGQYLGLVSREDIAEALLYLHLLHERRDRLGGTGAGVRHPA